MKIQQENIREYPKVREIREHFNYSHYTIGVMIKKGYEILMKVTFWKSSHNYYYYKKALFFAIIMVALPFNCLNNLNSLN